MFHFFERIFLIDCRVTHHCTSQASPTNPKPINHVVSPSVRKYVRRDAHEAFFRPGASNRNTNTTQCVNPQPESSGKNRAWHTSKGRHGRENTTKTSRHSGVHTTPNHYHPNRPDPSKDTRSPARPNRPQQHRGSPWLPTLPSSTTTQRQTVRWCKTSAANIICL